jgi:signal transduction histidine kinase
MHRYLFLILVWLTGIKALSQSPGPDSLLQNIAKGSVNQSFYFQKLFKVYDRFNESEVLRHMKKVSEVIGQRTGDQEANVAAFRTMANYFWSKALYSEALHLYDKAISTAVSSGYQDQAGITYQEISYRFTESELYAQALERVYRANSYFIRSGNRVRQAGAHSLAATIGFRAQNFAIAAEEVEKALSIYRSLDSVQLTHGDSIDLMSTLNTGGLAHAGMRNEEKAMACYAEAEAFATVLKNKFWIGLINGNKANVYAARGELDMAISSLEIDLHHSLEFKQWSSAIGSTVFLTELYAQKGKWEKARQFMHQAEALIGKYGTTRGQQARFYECKSRLLEHDGDIRGAFLTLQRHEEMSDSIEAEQRSSGLMRIKTAHDIRQKQSEIELLTAENKISEQQVAYRNIFVGAAVIMILLLFIIGYVIFRNYRLKKKDNELLLSRNNEIKSINEELQSYADAQTNQNQVIQKMNEELEQRVKKRTIQLEEINSELDMFLYRASHDIRRPITTLLGLSNLANATLKDASAVQMFDKVTETATHMDRMLHKLQMVYALNRPLGTGTPIQLKFALQNSIEKFSTEMKRIGMDCAVTASDSIGVEGDESLFSIIFQNMIENAITFRKSDELEKPHLRFEIIAQQEHVIVKIRDNGIGIESDYIEKIFDLHFRGTALSRGNGLGLYLVKKALLLLKGRIEVVSEYGVGSNFTIYFPQPSFPE